MLDKEEKLKNKLILGVGNDILTDDGIGPKIVEQLKGDIGNDDTAFQTSATGGLDILELIKDYHTVIIIDAIKTEGGVPGMIYYLTPSNFKETLHISSFHDVSFLTALKVAEKLNIPIPKQIDIIAIEIIEDLTFSNEFSKPIADKYEEIYKEILESVNNMI
jgi:hydrogenase maturation protease